MGDARDNYREWLQLRSKTNIKGRYVINILYSRADHTIP